MFLVSILWAILAVFGNAVQYTVNSEPTYECRSYPMNSGTTVEKTGKTTFWNSTTVVLNNGDKVSFNGIALALHVTPALWLRSDEQFGLIQDTQWGSLLNRSRKVLNRVGSDKKDQEVFDLYGGEIAGFKLEASKPVSMTLTPSGPTGYTETVSTEAEICSPHR